MNENRHFYCWFHDGEPVAVVYNSCWIYVDGSRHKGQIDKDRPNYRYTNPNHINHGLTIQYKNLPQKLKDIILLHNLP